MSVYSGKCDLADLIAGQGGYFDKNGNPVKFGDEGVGCYYSDEWLDFLAFKKKTNGVLYQHKNMKVNSYNHDEIKKHCENFDFKEVKTLIPDNRTNAGYREKRHYVYTYYGKEYTEKELNAKGGVYIQIEIKFDTLLDLLEYYPYLTSAVFSTENQMKVFIHSRSFVDEEFDSAIEHGYFLNSHSYYKKKLTEHYAEVALKYYNPAGHEVSEEITFDSNGVGRTSRPINERFPVQWDLDWLNKEKRNSSHWTSPKMIGSNEVLMSEQDLTHYIGNKAKIKYVEDFECPKSIGQVSKMDEKTYIIDSVEITCKITQNDGYSNCKVINSYKIISRRTQKAFLRKILGEYPVFQARPVRSYIREWRAHNTLFRWGVEEYRTRDADLNIDEKKIRRFCYFFLSLIPQQKYEPQTSKGETQE